MTLRIERFELGYYYTGYERYYRSGEEVDVEISAFFGLGTQPATLVSLKPGRGFIAGNKVIRPPYHIWTNVGWAVAE